MKILCKDRNVSKNPNELYQFIIKLLFYNTTAAMNLDALIAIILCDLVLQPPTEGMNISSGGAFEI